MNLYDVVKRADPVPNLRENPLERFGIPLTDQAHGVHVRIRLRITSRDFSRTAVEMPPKRIERMNELDFPHR